MSKRRLNKQQKKRIDDNMRSLADNANEQYSTGLVITHYGKEVDIIAIDADGNRVHGSEQRCHFRANLPTLVCGDKVKWRSENNSANIGIVESLLPRNTVIERPRPYQDPKPVAANIDLIVLVIAPAPEPITSLIDRYIIAAENANLPLAIVLNKIDLVDTLNNNALTEELEALFSLYRSLGYPVYKTQALGDTGQSTADQNAFVDLLQNKTSILVGQSGVGKSSIINALLGNNAAAVSQISSSNEKGRHTTTTSQMYFVADGNTAIIDSPGVREFGLWHLDNNAIIYGLREFRDFASACKFRDCEHGVSQGCALQEAFDTGKISASRIASYHHILNSRDNG